MVETLKHYKILDRVGAGGLGEVYRARDTQLGRTVAIKILKPEIADDLQRRGQFLNDATPTTALSHPNIATLYEIAEDQGQLFLVFEYVRGDSLKATIAGRPMNPRRAIELGVQIADALADAHALGIVHRDIKPGNIVVTAKGNAKILDFGLSAWTSGGEARRRAAALLPAAETAMETVAYLSPEQALGEDGDPRTDIFSLAIVLFEMLTGTRPFKATSPDAVTLQIVQAAAPSVLKSVGSLPPDLESILGRALSKSLDQRYEAATFAGELRSVAAVLDLRSEASEAAGVVVAPRARRRSFAGWIALAILVAALAAAWVERGAVLRLWP